MTLCTIILQSTSQAQASSIHSETERNFCYLQKLGRLYTPRWQVKQIMSPKFLQDFDSNMRLNLLLKHFMLQAQVSTVAERRWSDTS